MTMGIPDSDSFPADRVQPPKRVTIVPPWGTPHDGALGTRHTQLLDEEAEALNYGEGNAVISNLSQVREAVSVTGVVHTLGSADSKIRVDSIANLDAKTVEFLQKFAEDSLVTDVDVLVYARQHGYPYPGSDTGNIPDADELNDWATSVRAQFTEETFLAAQATHERLPDYLANITDTTTAKAALAMALEGLPSEGISLSAGKEGSNILVGRANTIQTYRAYVVNETGIGKATNTGRNKLGYNNGVAVRDHGDGAISFVLTEALQGSLDQASQITLTGAVEGARNLAQNKGMEETLKSVLTGMQASRIALDQPPSKDGDNISAVKFSPILSTTGNKTGAYNIEIAKTSKAGKIVIFTPKISDSVPAKVRYIDGTEKEEDRIINRGSFAFIVSSEIKDLLGESDVHITRRMQQAHEEKTLDMQWFTDRLADMASSSRAAAQKDVALRRPLTVAAFKA